MAKFKYFKNNQISDLNSKFNKLSYAQILKNNIIKIKDILLKLSVNKINKTNNIINKLSQKSKSRLNMTMKGPSRKQIIIFINTNNIDRIIVSSNMYVTNINRLLKDIKSEISINFI